MFGNYLSFTSAEDEFVDRINKLSDDPEGEAGIAEMLSENHPLYADRGSATISSMRGWALLGLSKVGVTDLSLPFVLEELQSGFAPYLIATAACALRSTGEPRTDYGPLLIRAIAEIRYSDEYMQFQFYDVYPDRPTETTAVGELLKALLWLGERARDVYGDIEKLYHESLMPGGMHKYRGLLRQIWDSFQQDTTSLTQNTCCGGLMPLIRRKNKPETEKPCTEQVMFEDHAGRQLTFREVFVGQPTITVFFYTRCDNPIKCSLSVSKLTKLQALLAEHQLSDSIRTVAITYDHAFDDPVRMKRYGQDRNLRMNDFNLMLRSIRGMDALIHFFDLNVNFVGSLVNRHRVELFLLDRSGRVVESFTRMLWDEQQVLLAATNLLTSATDLPVTTDNNPRSWIHSFALSFLATVGLILVPKCPACFVAYLGLFGLSGMALAEWGPFLHPLLCLLVLGGVLNLAFQQRGRHGLIRLYSIAAPVLMLLGAALSGWYFALCLGFVLLIIGSLLNFSTTRRPRRHVGTIS